jgi:hypothetical protein
MIQVGAFVAKRDAKDRLRSARSKARRLLGAAEPFTETLVKITRPSIARDSQASKRAKQSPPANISSAETSPA